MYKTRIYARFSENPPGWADKEDVSGENRTYGNPMPVVPVHFSMTESFLYTNDI